MRKIHVNTSSPYDVQIGQGFLADVGRMARDVKAACRAAIVSDDVVFSLYGDTVKNSLEKAGFSVVEYIFPNGERSKNFDTLGGILEFLARERVTRTDLVVALGGGVVGDMAGFAAAIYLRGIDFIQIPTTLLAAVDSSVGGKTAVDLASGKNLAGAFHQPIAVFCDTDTFGTLDDAQRACGMAEVIKYGLICDRGFFEALENRTLSDMDIVEKCVGFKRDIVERDEFDNGERKLLNFGHTLGHAVEKHSHFSLSHGAAVAIGMVMITEIAEKVGKTSEPIASRLRSILKKYHLPTDYAIDKETLFSVACGDKKTEGTSITPVFPKEIGVCIPEKMPLTDFKKHIDRL